MKRPHQDRLAAVREDQVRGSAAIRLARGLGRRLRWSILGQPDDGPAAARARAPSTDLVARNVSGIVTEGYSLPRGPGPLSASARRPVGGTPGLDGEVADIGDYAQACWAVTAVAAPEMSPASRSEH